MMNDERVIGAARSAFEDILDEAPLPPEWEQVTGQIVQLQPSKKRRGLVWAALSVVVLLIVAGSVVVSVVLRSDLDGDSVSSEATTTSSSMTVLDQEPALTLSPSLGPEPQFDTSVLGDEVVPDRSSDPEFVGPQLPFILEPGATFVGDPLYVGRVANRYGYALTAESDEGGEFCTALLNERGTGQFACTGGDFADLSGLVGSYSVSGEPDDVAGTDQLRAMYMVLDPDASVIAVEHSTGVRQWQRPFGSTGLFVIDGVDPTGLLTVSVYNAAGKVIDSRLFSGSQDDSGINPPAGVPDEAGDWCLTFEGSAAWRLEVDRIEFVPDGFSQESLVLPDGTRQSLEVIVDGEFETLSGGDLKNAQTELDAFLRYPTNSSLACRAAYQNR